MSLCLHPRCHMMREHTPDECGWPAVPDPTPPPAEPLDSIRAQWDDFDAKVLPKGCSALQRQEMRRAFYAGAQAMLALLTDIGDDSVSEDEGVRRLERFHEECRAFGRAIQKGEA